MEDLLLKIQSACLQLDGGPLVAFGLVAIGLGLAMWLGGVRYAFAVVGLLGALMGATLGLLASEWFELPRAAAVGGGALLLAILAVLLQRSVIMLLGAVILALVGGVTYFSYNVNEQSWDEALNKARLRTQHLSGSAESGDVAGDVELSGVGGGVASGIEPGAVVEAYRESSYLVQPDDSHAGGMSKLKNILSDLWLIIRSNRNMIFVWGLLGAGVGILFGYFITKIMMALCCSIVGATGIIGGMFSLLLAKDVEVLTVLQARPRVMPVLMAGMVIFGCLVQLALAGGAKSKNQDETKEENKK
ncbi:MAG: hypothetical protein JXD22_17280 [Sedimentisphaerales bacterium]|nr:hypothetical protein [Sedimentisphaerales bacterium]